MKQIYEKPQIKVIMFLPADPIANDGEKDGSAETDNGYVDYWSSDSDDSDT